ncbi:Chitinase 4, partial [Basidiobolus ranarum]
IQGSNVGFIAGPKLLVVNLPGYPTVPEFPQDGPNDGCKSLAAWPTITIHPNGKDIPTTTSTTSTTIPEPSTKTPKPSPTTSTKSTRILEPSTGPTSTPGAVICKSFLAWNSIASYKGAQKVTYKKHLWQAKWWTQKETLETSHVWTNLGAC